MASTRTPEETQDEAIIVSEEEKLLTKLEFNLCFSLHKCDVRKLNGDFCVRTAASCVRNSEIFQIHLKKRLAEVRAKFKQMNKDGRTAEVVAESKLLRICEQIAASKDDSIFNNIAFRALVHSWRTSPASKDIYETRKQIYKDIVAPELNKIYPRMKENTEKS